MSTEVQVLQRCLGARFFVALNDRKGEKKEMKREREKVDEEKNLFNGGFF
jgi:hypothetical protein